MQPEHWDRPYPRPRLVERQPGPCATYHRRQYDRASQMLALVIVICFVAVFAFSMGIVHGRVNPAKAVPVGEVEADFERYVGAEGP